jgi:hypothetical protein
LIPAPLSGETLDARNRVTDKCHDTSWTRPWLPSEIADRPHESLGRFDDAQRGAHPDTSWDAIEEVRTLPKSRTFRSTPCAPLHENYSLFAINQQCGDAPARGAKMHQP